MMLVAADEKAMMLPSSLIPPGVLEPSGTPLVGTARSTAPVARFLRNRLFAPDAPGVTPGTRFVAADENNTHWPFELRTLGPEAALPGVPSSVELTIAKRPAAILFSTTC